MVAVACVLSLSTRLSKRKLRLPNVDYNNDSGSDTAFPAAQRGTVSTLSSFNCAHSSTGCATNVTSVQTCLQKIPTIQAHCTRKANKVQSSIPWRPSQIESSTAISRSSTLGSSSRRSKDQTVPPHDATRRQLHALVLDKPGYTCFHHSGMIRNLQRSFEGSC